MGGYGSGRTGGNPIAEHCLQIDICWMLREGKAREGERTAGDLQWSFCGQPSCSITYLCDLIDLHDAKLILKFSRDAGSGAVRVLQYIPLRFTVPYFGGRRWWMVCPVEHIPVAKLYMPINGHHFASRKALCLGYRSQRIAPADTPLERLFRIEAKFGRERGCVGRPVRPMGMWQRTFDRHMAEYDKLSKQVGECMGARVMWQAAQYTEGEQPSVRHFCRRGQRGR